MPVMGGNEATRIIRNQLNYTGTLIGVTGNALPEDLKDFITNGATDVVTKPVELNQFRRIFGNGRT